MRFHDVGDYIADLAIHSVRFAVFDCLHQGVVSCLDELLRRFADFADVKGFVQIAVVSIFVDADVDVDNVALFKGPSVWDSMTDDLIDGGAARTRETIVI